MKKSIILLIAIVGYFGYNYVMAPSKDIHSSKADVSIQSAVLWSEFSKNSTVAEKKYTDKVVSITGTITEIVDNGVTIDNKVFCQLASTKNLQKAHQITVKGLFIGYDDLFDLVKLDQGRVLE